MWIGQASLVMRGFKMHLRNISAGEAVLLPQGQLPSMPAATRAAAAWICQHVHEMKALAETLRDDRRFQPSA